jgi:hypothetical protein
MGSAGDGISGGPPRDPFPGITLPSGTGAPGSEVPQGEGPVIGTPVVMDVGDSAQVPGELGRALVTAGDTTQGDPAAHTVISAGGDDYVSTGAGEGQTMTNEHGRYPWQQKPGA